MDDIYVYLVDLPTTVPEMVAPCIGGGFTIYLNARLSYQDRVKAYLHALEHVTRNDWSREDVQQIEKEAHDGIV
ncbi:MAG: hypothetical protein J6S50_00455 [Oscillospiraceae bacterium]|nr:hypothetical protein [Oscillospiraceae bacterium]MBO7726972.1 hypothetical protein [Oscillospiraceae bacterium]